MKRFWEIAYSYAVIPLLWVLLHLAALADRKIRRGIAGRRGLADSLRRMTSALPPGPRVWFHASSLGEFEQAKPIIELLRARRPDVRVIATFFSPSGYEHSRKYPHADVIAYIPFDSRGGARMFVETVRPDLAVMVRYDVWPNHIWELRRRNIPVMIANATMRSATPRRLPVLRGFHRRLYDAIDCILTVSEADRDAFRSFGLTRPVMHAIGDTRFDRVSGRSAEAKRRHIIPERIVGGRRVIVAGSTWPEDEQVLLPAYLRLPREDILLILVPHEPTVSRLEDLEAELRGRAASIRFSALNEYAGERVIIVDSIGILLTLYAYARIAYVGGSFRQGVHNVLEAAVYGVPVLFGPRHRNSREPIQLVHHGGGFVANDEAEVFRALENLLRDDAACSAAGRRALEFVQSHVGATARCIGHLESLLPPVTK